MEDKDDDFSEFGNSALLQSPGSRSGISEYDIVPSSSNRSYDDTSFGSEPISANCSPYREPPPYKPPPKVLPYANQNQQQYKECVDEFKSALSAIGGRRTDSGGGSVSDEPINMETMSVAKDDHSEKMDSPPEIPPKLKQGARGSLSREQSMDSNDGVRPDDPNENKENLPMTPLKEHSEHSRTLDKQISVKEATKKFNRIASEEEANKIISPPGKKKPEKVCLQIFFINDLFFPCFLFNINQRSDLLILIIIISPASINCKCYK